MRANHIGMLSAPGFLFIAAAMFCLIFGSAVFSPVLAQGQPGAPPQAPGGQNVPAGPVAPPIPQGGFAPIPEAPSAPLPQPPAATAEVAGITCPPEYVPLVQKTTMALLKDDFTFYPMKAMDPFHPFISLETTPALARVPGEGDEETREPDRPLTPLQKMTMAELERGLRAISWGALGRRALIEDSTGKGYIVSVGTPAGERNGVVTQILNDRLVIQQEIWDRQAKKRFPQDFIIKLSKKTGDRQ